MDAKDTGKPQVRMCWLCGKQLPITDHHAIPQRLLPKKNMKIPVCRDCHDLIDEPVIQVKIPNKIRKKVDNAIHHVSTLQEQLKSIKYQMHKTIMKQGLKNTLKRPRFRN